MLLTVLGGAFAVGSFAYLALALRQTTRGTNETLDCGWRPPVTILVPVHGAPKRLEECLRSICAQDYPSLQVVFGLHSDDDPARAVIERVQAAFPTLDTTLVIDDHRVGSNPKNANLANMIPSAKHDILAMIDSDVLPTPDFLAEFIRPLAEPGTGGVTCLYSGVPGPDLISRIGALHHNDWFIPSVLVDLSRREMDICFGAAIAVTRESLAAIGGIESMADAVAQDFVFGHRLHQYGYTVRLASPVIPTIVEETTLSALIAHELRWNRTIRAIRPLDHALSIFMSPLGPMLLLALIGWPAWMAGPLIVLHVALRIRLHYRLRRRFPFLPPAAPWMVPVRELLNFVVWCRALTGRTVRWGETVLVTGPDLTMKPVHDEPIS